MAIPDFQSIMLPLLKYLNDKKEHTSRDTYSSLARLFNLTEEEEKMLLPSGVQEIFYNRIAWAKAHLKMAGLVEDVRRGIYRITEKGEQVLKQKPERIDIKVLKQLPGYKERVLVKKEEPNDIEDESVPNGISTPEESIEFGFQRLRSNLEVEILNRVKGGTPEFFERLVIELLVKMGYGGSRLDAGKAIGKSGDAGIDGIIKEDKLGLDVVYIQAKRWTDTVVGRPEIQKFVGAIAGQRATKGIFITSSTFSSEAQEYIKQIGTKVVLIDGEKLAEYMVDHNVGVTISNVYEVKRIDSDYFNEE